jgi:tRNA U38,U39,U40 pseudouridine synthase TruA
MMQCALCNETFSSKNKLFKHLTVHGVTSKTSSSLKVSILVGWVAPECSDTDEHVKDGTLHSRWMDEMDPAEEALWKAVDHIEPASCVSQPGQRRKGFTRASSCESRASFVFGMERSCHAVCDVFCFSMCRNPDIPSIPALLLELNAHLPPSVRALHMQELPKAVGTKLHAEYSCSQRLFEYLIPRRLLLPPLPRGTKTDEHENGESTAAALVGSGVAGAGSEHLGAADGLTAEGNQQLSPSCVTLHGPAELRQYRYLKSLLKAFVSEGRREGVGSARRNVHNLVAGGGLPDESVTSRKIDRVSVREVLREPPQCGVQGGESCPCDCACPAVCDCGRAREWLVISISADALLAGQARKMVGLVVAIMQGWLPHSYLEAVLSDDVVDAPPAPGASLYLCECRFAKLEAGSADNHFRLDPRRASEAGAVAADTDGAGPPGQTVEVKRAVARYHAANPADDWLETFRRQCGLLQTKREVMLATLSRHCEASAAAALPLERLCAGPMSVASTPVSVFAATVAEGVRAQYAEVLRLLREADASGRWPANSVGRQKVIIGAEEVHSAAQAAVEAKIQVVDAEVQAEAVQPGGSFTVGVLPPPLAVPNGNRLFPELLKACFLLERRLCPNRPPSSTIAINRHAQFRAHRDNGAGNGQTVSLIVGLGDYTGGECAVEGVAHDIRYRPMEFDGWNSRHWTLPFRGERYSLVWFTPMGVRVPEDLWWLPDMPK